MHFNNMFILGLDQVCLTEDVKRELLQKSLYKPGNRRNDHTDQNLFPRQLFYFDLILVPDEDTSEIKSALV